MTISPLVFREHKEVAEKVRNFLNIESRPDFIPDLTEDASDIIMGEDSDSTEGEDTADDFEKVDKSELPAELTETAEEKDSDTVNTA